MNRLPVSKTFQENVNGTLQARFLLEDGVPSSFEDDGATCYWIELSFVPNRDVAQKIEDVTFYLHESYHDPVRLAERDREGVYRETISSYGDFVVTVEVTIAGRSFRQQMWLSDMLQAGQQGQTTTSDIAKALRDIETH